MIIPTRDRLRTLRRTLAALAEQRLDGVKAEVIVVDNGSADDTLGMLERLTNGYPLPLRTLAEPSPGAGPARNAGLTAARGDIVLFLGDDTRPAGPDLLRRHAELHTTATARPYAVLGRVGWAPELEVTPLMRWLEHGGQFAYADMRPDRPTRSISTRPCLDPPAPAPGGGWLRPARAVPVRGHTSRVETVRGGLALDYHPELLVHHDHAITLAGWLQRQEKVGRAGRRVRELHDVEERLVPRPGGWRWTAAEGDRARLRLAGVGVAALARHRA